MGKVFNFRKRGQKNGLDLDDLEFMNEDERREALEEAGYDPDGFDDDF